MSSLLISIVNIFSYIFYSIFLRIKFNNGVKENYIKYAKRFFISYIFYKLILNFVFDVYLLGTYTDVFLDMFIWFFCDPLFIRTSKYAFPRIIVLSLHIFRIIVFCLFALTTGTLNVSLPRDRQQILPEYSFLGVTVTGKRFDVWLPDSRVYKLYVYKNLFFIFKRKVFTLSDGFSENEFYRVDDDDFRAYGYCFKRKGGHVYMIDSSIGYRNGKTYQPRLIVKIR